MVTQQLLDYINQQLQSGVNKDQLKNTLITSGWNEKDIDEALNQTNSFSGNNASISGSNFLKKLPKILVICTIFVLLVGGSIYAYNTFIKSNRLPATPSRPETSQQPTPPAKTSREFVQFNLPKPLYSLVISGEIKKGYSNVELKPFFFVTSITKGLGKEKPSSEAQFKILLKKNGSTFLEDNLDATECIDWSPGDYCGKFDRSYGSFVHAIDGFSELPDEIVFQHLGKDIYNLKEPTNPFSSLALISQEYTDGLIKISWEVKGENKKLNYLAYVSNNNFQVGDFSSPAKTMPLLEDNLNNDGSKVFSGNSFTFSSKGFIEGDLQVAIYATDGFRTYVAYSKKFTTKKSQVEAKIRLPENGKTYDQNYVPLEAESFDPRSGLRCGGCVDEGNTFTWTSSLDGVISNNHDTYCQFLTPGSHKITLQIKNQNGTEASTSINIRVNPVSIISEAETKARQQKGETCYK
ncbi:hypothetical protein KKA69_04010 [Patescibacteria group bacterium]|nr:hypothetical protein [Patescibacteria group bacterium]